MGLLKLISNRISTEWKEKFNKNIDYLNDLEKKLSDQDKSTNSRIDNLVLHSGGDSPNEVVDARVNHKGETFATLQGRLTDTEKKVSESVSTLEKNQADIKAQVAQLNNSVETIIGGSADWINLYVSANLGSDQIGDGSEEKPFATIQMAVNQIPLVSIPGISILVDDGVYLEDVFIRNVSATTIHIGPKNDTSVIDPSKSDMPVKLRSLTFYQCKGFFKVTGLQFVDTINAPKNSGLIYSLMLLQGGYLSVDKCKFAEDNRNLISAAIYTEGLSASNVYNTCYFYRQNIVVYANLMSQVLISQQTSGKENTTGARSKDAIIRGKFSVGFADINEDVKDLGLIITKGTVLS
ncbi:hypothetical protein [Enterococcus faecium]|nr:hypothetical protein [Enterococcus faecium]MDY5173553.1 hypothetical protein [Enterococcus faecium]